MRPYASRLASEADRKSCSILFWGSVVNNAEIFNNENGKTKVKFSVRYDKGKFFNCHITDYGTNVVLQHCAMLEKGDIIFATGEWSSKKYTNKNGEEKNWEGVRIEFISTQNPGRFSENTTQSDNTSEQEESENIIEAEYELGI